MSIYKYIAPTDKGYEVIKKPNDYFSKRYKKRLSVDEGYNSDGATFYWDLDSWFWLWHDVATDKDKWKDGSHCSNWQASLVAFDILMNENRYIHAPVVFTGTLVYGYIKQLFKGLR